MKKKLTCFIAIILILCLLPSQVFAASVQPRKEFFVIMALCATGANWSSNANSSWFGHVFLAFYNDSDFTIQVGHMSVPAGGFITVGTFPKDAHDGIWYNIEAHAQPNGVYALEYLLTDSQLEDVNSIINRNNSYSVITDNCTHFAGSVWNSIVSSSLQVEVGIPQYTINDIKAKDSYFTNYTFPSKPLSSIAYHTATGVTYDSSGASSGSSS